MGFFKNIGKAISGAVKEVGKVVSVKNAMNFVTGEYGAIVKDAVGRAKDAGLQLVGGIAQATGIVKGGSSGGSAAPAGTVVAVPDGTGGYKPAVVAVNPYAMTVKPGKATLQKDNILNTTVTAAKTTASQQFQAAKGVSNQKSLIGDVVDDWANDVAGKIQKDVDTWIDEKTGKAFEKIGDKLIEVPVVKSFMDRLSKVALKYYWAKYKTWFIVAGLGLAGFLIWWFKFRKPTRGRRR